MYPVLVVEGKEFSNIDLCYRNGKLTNVSVWDEDNKLKNYYNQCIENYSYVENSLILNFDECLKWKHRYDDVHKEIENVISAKDSLMMSLAIKNIHEELPFTPNKTQKEYFKLLEQQIGLMDALEIVEEFMEEDVELEGAEC